MLNQKVVPKSVIKQYNVLYHSKIKAFLNRKPYIAFVGFCVPDSYRDCARINSILQLIIPIAIGTSILNNERSFCPVAERADAFREYLQRRAVVAFGTQPGWQMAAAR